MRRTTRPGATALTLLAVSGLLAAAGSAAPARTAALAAPAAVAVAVGAALELPAAPAAPAGTAAAAAPARTAVPEPAAAAAGRIWWQAPPRNVFSARSIWRAPVLSAKLNRRSPAMVRQLAGEVAQYYGGIAAFNAHQYNVSFVSVPRNQRRITVLWNNCQRKDYTPAGLKGRGGVLTAVPIPGRAHSAVGTDGELTIYSATTDQLWELWQAKKLPNGRWSACWGGRIDHVSTTRGWFTGGFGASASGLALAGGMVSLADIRRGSIDHAISLGITDPAPWNIVSWPAQRSDGSPASRSIIPEGTRFRLARRINLGAMHLTPIALMIARAAQRYGFIVTDMSGCVAVGAEGGTNMKMTTGVNPWDRLLGSTPDYLQLRNFPWNRLQALPRNWGEPAR